MFAWQEQERRLRNAADLCKAHSSQTIGVTTKSIGDVDNEDEDENYEASTEDEESDESDEADYSDASADNYSDASIHLRRSSRQRQPPERYIGESVELPSQRGRGRTGRGRGRSGDGEREINQRGRGSRGGKRGRS